MPSPFPGMDPYLEGALWPDVHQSLAHEIRRQLMPLLTPKYVARVVMRTVIESLSHGGAIGVTIPDVEISATGRRVDRPSTPATMGVLDRTPMTPFKLRQKLTFLAEIPSIEIRTTSGDRLVTSIEILSPGNKTRFGWQEYQAKRAHVIQAHANLLEIDLLRRGIRAVSLADAPRTAYYVTLTRATDISTVEVWPLSLRDKLPNVVVPLLATDPDVALDLQACLDANYAVARYDLSIDYAQAPNPPLTGADAVWAASLTGEWLRANS